MGKRKPVHWSVINDSDLEHFGAIAILEPYIYKDPADDTPTQGNHRNWNIFLPTTRRAEGHVRHSYRAAIWVNQGIQAQQVPIDSYDIVAVNIPGKERDLLLVAAYDPAYCGIPSDQVEGGFREKIDKIGKTIDEAKGMGNARDHRTSVLLCTDFNRHHPLWTGYEKGFGGGGLHRTDPIIDLAASYDLRSLLPAGTITWEHQSGRLCSTNDVIWANTEEEERLQTCQIYGRDHGSDHRPIEIHLEWEWERQGSLYDEPRLDWKRADWKEIEAAVAYETDRSLRFQPPTSPYLLDAWVEGFQDYLAGVIRKNVLEARPSPYAKRWWSPELSTLRQTMVTARNQATKLKRRGAPNWVAQYEAFILVRNRYFGEMEKQKKRHWMEFLENPDNIWKASRYTKTASSQRGIPFLTRTNGEKVEDDREKAKMLMETFFPTPPQPQEAGEQGRGNGSGRRESPPYELPPITEQEIQQAVRQANPRKAPGIDGVNFGVWQRLLPHTVRWMQVIF